MTLVAVCSLKGSPGVTTFSVALAARWPAGPQCVLVECDPAGGDLATRFGLSASPGLVSLAAAARRDTNPGLLLQHTQALAGGFQVVAGPAGADQARAALAALGADEFGVLQRAARLSGTVVIADCGRLDTDSPAWPIMPAADGLLLLARPRTDDLTHLVSRLPAISRWSPPKGLLLVGDGYSSAEVRRELGVPVMARIPDDPRGAAVLCGRTGLGRILPRSPVGRIAQQVVSFLISELVSASSGEGPSADVGRSVAAVPVSRSGRTS